MESNNFIKSTDRSAQRRTAGIHDVNSFNNLADRVVILNNNFKKLNVNAISNIVCENCAGDHPSMECQVGNPFETNSSDQVNII